MKKLLATIAILGTLTLLGSPMAQAASAKAGAACSKAGSTQVVSGKKFTCVKSGKKLVWNKGVAVVAKPAPTAPVLTLDSLDKEWTLKVALANVQNKLKSLPVTNISPEMIYSPTTTEAEKKLEAQLLGPAMKLFQEYFVPEKYQVVMFTNLDSEWADQAFLKYGGSFPFKLSDEIARKTANGSPCGFAFATLTSSRQPIFYECTDTRQIRRWQNNQTPPHEYFHLVQQKLSSVQMPAWLVEGSASFFGEAIGFASFANPTASKREMNLNTAYEFDPDGKGFDSSRFKNWTRAADATEVTRIYKILEQTSVSNSAGNKHAYYSLGSIATEVLVAVYGVDGFMRIWPALATGQSFESAFKTTFGLTPDAFYAKITSYLNKLY
jgi:hypothetical protein